MAATSEPARLVETVVAVERELFRNDEEASSTGMCLPASLVLMDRLAAAGFEAELAYGTFALDDPDPEAWEGEGCDDNGCDGPPAHAYTPAHYWVMVGGTVCDITADQFADECDDPFGASAVIVDPLGSEASSRHTLLKRSPDYELLDDDAEWVACHCEAA